MLVAEVRVANLVLAFVRSHAAPLVAGTTLQQRIHSEIPPPGATLYGE